MNSLIFLLLLILPYNFFTPEIGGAITVIFGLIYLMYKRIYIFNINKTIFLLLLLISIIATFSIFKYDIMSSVAGIFVYVTLLVYYLIFTNMEQKQKEIIINNSKIFILVYSLLATVIEGLILKTRVDGLLQYANTFSLILLIFLYINRIQPFNKNNLSTLYEIILTTGILFSQSRGTFIYFIIYVIYFTFIKKDKHCLKNSLIALLIYFSFASRNIILIILLPMIIYTILMFEKYLLLFIGITIPLVVILQNKKIADTIRIFKIKFNTPNLQVRFIYYLDAVKSIIKKPLGYGIGSYVYLQKFQQTYNYNIRYVHNSFIQIAYDLGLIALVLFIILLIYLLLKMYKLNIKNNRIYVLVIITLIMHSLLDFNFSFAEIMIILSYILSLIKTDKVIKINYKFMTIIIFICIYVSTQFILLKSTDNIKSISLSKGLLTISNKMAFNRDAKVYLKLAEISFKKEDNKNPIETVDHLKKGYAINPYDYKFISLLAIINEDINENESIKYYDKLIEIDKYNDKVYKRYIQYLKRKYINNQEFYKQKFAQVEKQWIVNKMQTNDIAKKYIKK